MRNTVCTYWVIVVGAWHVFGANEENEVDIEALSLLDDEQIRLLIPAIGPQAKFKRVLKEWKTSKLNSEICDNIENLVNVYGESVNGLTNSPISSALSSPSTSSCYSSVLGHDNLTTLIEKSPYSLQLLKDRQQPLGEQNRKVLVREIATQILRANPKATITAETYIYWIEEIKKVFPKENSSIYYTKPKGSLGHAHGRLFDAVTNLKAKYRRNKIFEPRARRSLEKVLTPKPSTSSSSERTTAHFVDLLASDNDDNTNQELLEMIELLKSNVDDYSSCAVKWDKTNKERLKRILSNEKESYIQEFPCIRRSWGYNLLIADFDAWYPGNKTSFDDKFPLLKVKLLAAFDRISRKSAYLAELKKLACDPDHETSNLAVLLLIPHLLGPVYIRKKKRSAVELRENFILHNNAHDILRKRPFATMPLDV